MNYIPALLGKKGRFATVWFAAHHPSKLNRVEVITIDLEEKCGEIEKFILNGRSNLPRFSLFVSAHLMFGLVIILNKKISYLLDDMVQLRADLNRPYYMPTVVDSLIKTAPKTPKTPRTKKAAAAKEAAVTLKEVLPEFIDKDVSMDTLIDMEARRVVEYQPTSAALITMQDTFDLYDRSLLIPVEEHDFVTDMFGAPPGAPIDRTLLFEPKPAEAPVARPEEPSALDTFLEEARGGRVPVTGGESIAPIGIPELYQETLMMEQPVGDETLAAVPQPPPELTTAPEPMPSPPRPPIVRARRRRAIIIDQHTKIPSIDLVNRAQQDHTSTSYSRPEIRLNLFRSQFENMNYDLIREPRHFQMKDVHFKPSSRDPIFYPIVRMRQAQMKSSKEPNHQFCYLLAGREFEEISVSDVTMGSAAEASDLERQRRMSRERESERRGLRTSTLEKEIRTRDSMLELMQTKVRELGPLEEQPADVHMRLEFDEASMMPQPGGDITIVPEISEAPLYEPNEMQANLMTYIREKREARMVPVLQSFISEKSGPERNKRKFAARAFFNTLVLLKYTKISAEQTATYGAIKLDLIQ